MTAIEEHCHSINNILTVGLSSNTIVEGNQILLRCFFPPLGLLRWEEDERLVDKDVKTLLTLSVCVLIEIQVVATASLPSPRLSFSLSPSSLPLLSLSPHSKVRVYGSQILERKPEEHFINPIETEGEVDSQQCNH